MGTTRKRRAPAPADPVSPTGGEGLRIGSPQPSNSEEIEALNAQGQAPEVALEGTLAAAERETRSVGGDKGRPPGQFQLLGQTFGTLDALHAWLVSESANPESTVPHEPVLHITVTPGSIVHERKQTTWTYYSPHQRVVIDGSGAVVSGMREGKRPTPGFFLAYRPVVGAGTSQDAPAPANFSMTGLTVRGYESGGVEISPQTAAGRDHRWDGGNTAFVEGAVIEGNRFEKLGSKNAAPGEANWSKQRYGVGGVLLRGVSNSTVSHNTFDGLENGEVEGSRFGPGLIHAVYVRDRSSGNDIRGNRFEDVSGDPIRFSNASNGNTVAGNSTRNTGVHALVSEFYNPTAGEADSTGNAILPDNRIGTLYGRRKKGRRFDETVSHGKRPALQS